MQIRKRTAKKRAGYLMSEWTIAELVAVREEPAPISTVTGEPNLWAKFKLDSEALRELERRGRA